MSDPTDRHSLEELRAHLEDGGDMQPVMLNAEDVAQVMQRLQLHITHERDAFEFANRKSLNKDGQLWGSMNGLNVALRHMKEAFETLEKLTHEASERSGDDGQR